MTVHQINLHRLILVVALGISVALTMGCAKDAHDHSKHDDDTPKKDADDHSKHDHSKHDADDGKGSTPKASGNQDAAIQKQIAAYPVDMCIISDEKLDDHGKPVNYMHDGRLVRFCCNDCIAGFKKDPDKYLAKLDAAKKAGAKKAQ